MGRGEAIGGVQMSARLSRMGRPEHTPLGDPCAQCGFRASQHRKRNRSEYKDETFVAIDGEGRGRKPHRYTYMAAVDEHNHCLGDVSNTLRGLSSHECLSFLVGLGRKRVFGYSLGYDVTKWLEDLPDRDIYRLLRPDMRRKYRKSRKTGKLKATRRHAPIQWRGFELDWLAGKLTIRRYNEGAMVRGKRAIEYTGEVVTVWDVFKFYQGKFTKALTDWNTALEKPIPAMRLAAMIAMKDSRADSDLWRSKSEADIRAYCRDECFYMAQLVRALNEAHDACDLHLNSFHGAGSTAKALLRKYSIKQYLKKPSKEMEQAVLCAFAGGRFENAWVGPIRKRVRNRDISSAYPYHITFLPCLVHGRWDWHPGTRGINQRIRGARLALVHAKVHRSRGGPEAYGPFAWRSVTGDILFPRACDGTWVWKDEFLAGQALWPGVEARGAWLYYTDCDCQPFKELPAMYIERCKWGKEGRGQPLKLGPNAIYGCLAQTVGDSPYHNLILAGVVTSNTRAQLLRALAMTEDSWSFLMFATDGIFSTSDWHTAAPRETGTASTGKPLGGWETKEVPDGMFLLRPGVYFPLNVTDAQEKEVRARGMSKAVLLKNAELIEQRWEEYRLGKLGRNRYAQCDVSDCKIEKWHFHVHGLQRFVGAKTAVQHYASKGYTRSEDYGQWIDYPVDVSFDPKPKRDGMLDEQRLKPYEYMPGESAPYNPHVRSAEALAMMATEEMVEEQPGGDFVLAA